MGLVLMPLARGKDWFNRGQWWLAVTWRQPCSDGIILYVA